MSNVNDNNLDDLLRRAAEKYPLRTDSADWEKLVSDLDKDPSLVLPPMNGEDRRRRRRFLWLFLLLPLAGAGYYIIQKYTPAGQTVTQANKNGQGQTAGQGQTDRPAIKAKAAQTGQTTVLAEQGQSGQTSAPAAKGVHVGATSEPAGDKAVAERKAGQEKHVGGEKVVAGEGGHVGGENIVAGKNPRSGGHVGGEYVSAAGHSTAGRSTAGSSTTGSDLAGEVGVKNINVQRAATRGNVAVNIPVKSNAIDQKKIRLQKPKPSFYVGIIGSPDLSSIKFQSVKKVGSSYGLLFGYGFNSRWAVETGVSFGKKKYFTDGEYFDKTNAYILKYVDQLKVEGTCTMWEIPLNVRYNFSTGEKMKWFATGGVTAYYMSREQYDCAGYLNGAPWGQDWDRKPSHHSWSSNLNLSVGYEQRLGRIGNLRLEPYLRVPISGIGTGKLSIMSAGLNIGITRRIW